ncbi:MAG: 50S ribosomal protein L23 [Actinomycetaceae bacterium]|nr:50S ribosomal protein L23 [Actinomycetaceae bacterium]MDY6082830.1 50S ribosomal protein L23 [Actinomycetaceae bacterium]
MSETPGFWNKHPQDVILRPVTTEKSAGLEDQGKYTFEVDASANKTEIKHAVEAIFHVKVASVNTLHRKGKARRTITGIGYRKDTKRAVVTLREGSIDIYGDVVA